MELNQPKLLTVRTMGLLLTAVLGLSADGYNTMPGYTGENVPLMCPDSSCNTWSSVRLQRHGNSDTYISYCRDGHATDPKRQDRSFVGRVEGIKCPMEDGNVSVTLKNLTRNDTGYYEWFGINSDGTNFTYTVYLNVEDAADGDNRTGDHVNRNTTDAGANTGIIVVVVGVPAAAGIIIGIVCFCRSKRCTIPCRKDKQQTSDQRATYRYQLALFVKGYFTRASEDPEGTFGDPVVII